MLTSGQAIAVVATGVLMFSNFPPSGSTLVDEDGIDNREEEQLDEHTVQT